MKNHFQLLYNTILFLLILLWVYTAVSKLLIFEHFKFQMSSQTIPRWLTTVLTYLLPPVELFAAGLLFPKRTQFAGLLLSFILMFLFTGYVGLVVINYFGGVPCSCGGVIRNLTWRGHLFFNLFFLLLTGLGIYIANRERRSYRQY